MWRLSNRWERNKFDVLRYDGDEDYCLRPFDDLKLYFLYIYQKPPEFQFAVPYLVTSVEATPLSENMS